MSTATRPPLPQQAKTIARGTATRPPNRQKRLTEARPTVPPLCGGTKPPKAPQGGRAGALATICLTLLVACADGTTSSAPVDAGADAADAPPFTWPDLLATFGTLETVAGRGEVREGEVNGWRPTFEGGLATEAELSRPHIALSDDAGNVYIADKDAHAVRRVSPEGRIMTVAGTGEAGDDGDGPRAGATSRLDSPNGLWVRGDGVIYILDLGNDKVRRLSGDGTLTTLFRADDLGDGRGLYVAEDETVAVVAAGDRLLRWTRGGGVETLADGFVSLGNLAVGPDGTLAVTDRGGHRVYRVEPDGQKVPIAGNGGTSGGGDGQPALSTGLDEVRGVWFHPRGGYFLATHKGGQVWWVDPEGVIHRFLDGDTDHTHAGDGQHFRLPGPKISEPRAVTMDRQGNLLVTENDYGYVRRVRAVE